jgi:hypothetical protein
LGCCSAGTLRGARGAAAVETVAVPKPPNFGAPPKVNPGFRPAGSLTRLAASAAAETGESVATFDADFTAFTVVSRHAW